MNIPDTRKHQIDELAHEIEEALFRSGEDESFLATLEGLRRQGLGRSSYRLGSVYGPSKACEASRKK